MEDLILFLILFVLFFVFFLVDYIIKRKKHKLNKLIGIELVRARKEDYEKIGLILVLVNSLIISISGVLCTMIDMKKTWQLLYGFVLLSALIYIFYSIIRNTLEKKYKNKKEM